MRSDVDLDMKRLILAWAFLLSLLMVGVAQEGKKKVTTKPSGDGTKETIVTEYYNTNDSTLQRREVIERDKNSASPIAGYAQSYQGGKLVLDENWGPGPMRQRTFYRDGSFLVTQMDEDGDGRFEWVVVHGEDGKAIATFRLSGQQLHLLDPGAAESFNNGAEIAEEVFPKLTNDGKASGGVDQE
jgi:hypothetical protein